VRVLVVDDHQGFREALTAALGLMEGLVVAGTAPDGESAVVAADELRPDVVLMDMSMPGISGIEATVRIHQRLPLLPVVMLTAHAAPGIEDEALAAGVSVFLAKGSPFEEIVEALLNASVTPAAGGQLHAAG
jgi:DNA-binding NarL/FixJ family response regulator